jgi:hypothetical protein
MIGADHLGAGIGGSFSLPNQSSQSNQQVFEQFVGVKLNTSGVSIINNTPNNNPSWLRFGLATGWFNGQ